MDKLIVSVNRQWHRLKASDEPVFLGRSFNSDIIVSDAYVAAQQLRFFVEGDTWRVENLDATNPLRLNKKIQKQSVFSISSGDNISIGRTAIAFYAQDFKMPAPKQLSVASWLQYHSLKYVFLLLVLVGFLFINGLLTWVDSVTQFTWNSAADTAGFQLLFVVVWAGLWSIVGKALTAQSHFLSHVFFTCLFSTAIYIALYGLSIVEYMLQWNVDISKLATVAIVALLMSMLIGLHFNLVSDMKYYFRNACVICLCFAAAVMAKHYVDKGSFSNYLPLQANIKPPLFFKAETQSIDDFIAAYDTVFAELDQGLH